jgi:hypothetical protein
MLRELAIKEVVSPRILIAGGLIAKENRPRNKDAGRQTWV